MGLRFILLAPLLVVVGCAGGSVTVDRYRGSMASPEDGVEYFQNALIANDPPHEYLVLSEELKRTFFEKEGIRLSFSNYLQGREQVLQNLKGQIGDLKDIEVGDATRLSPYRARVPLTSGDRMAQVEMVLEVVCTVDLGGGEQRIFRVPSDAKVVEVTKDALVLTVPREGGDPASFSRDDVYRVSFERLWKISNFRALTEDVSRMMNQTGSVAPESKNAAPKTAPRPETTINPTPTAVPKATKSVIPGERDDQ